MLEISKKIPVVIPSYKPDENLLNTCRSLIDNGLENIVVVDDGGGAEYAEIFDKVRNELHCTVLVHEVNRGKGRGLKTAFSYIINEMPDAIGCVTADADGQHLPEDILACMKALEENPTALVLGCRDFSGDDVPTKSRFGNELTKKVCASLCGVKVSDTQTGLRSISLEFMKHLLNVKGERFEFETNMLVECKDRVPIVEVSIATVYDSKEDHKSHFNPFKDSMRIYAIFGKIFLKYMLSSLTSCAVDLVLFYFLNMFFEKEGIAVHVILATVLARIVSATVNCLINFKVVFNSHKNLFRACLKYFGVVIIQLCCSASLVFVATEWLHTAHEVVVKAIVDTVLFFISFFVQRRFVF